jgi:hypothetical protein
LKSNSRRSQSGGFELLGLALGLGLGRLFPADLDGFCFRPALLAERIVHELADEHERAKDDHGQGDEPDHQAVFGRAAGLEVSVWGVSLIVVADYPQADDEDINATHENS